MEIIINGIGRELADGTKCSEILTSNQIAIVDGYQLTTDDTLVNGDNVLVVDKGVMPSEIQLHGMLSARHSEGLSERLTNAKVAICGLGGLGSNIAVMLARAGVGELLVVDYDTVDPTNLNRQAYYIRDLGKYKVMAMTEQISRINPYCKVIAKNVKIDASNCVELLADYRYIVEAFDRADAKALLVREILSNTGNIIVASSGMAGYYSSNTIRTVRKTSNLYVCGDGENESKKGNGLMSARVGICAGHQANMIIRLILGEMEV